MGFYELLWAIFLTFVVSCSLFRLFLMGMISDFIFFSFVGGLRVAEPLSLIWGHPFFCFGSLLQRRKTFSDFVGLTSPQGGKGSYITFFFFLTLRPGLLLVVTFILYLRDNGADMNIGTLLVPWFRRWRYIAYSC